MDDVRGPDPADPARLTRMNRLATEARLVAGLAHELNNSLQVVGGLVELLATRTDLPSDAVARLEKVSGRPKRRRPRSAASSGIPASGRPNWRW